MTLAIDDILRKYGIPPAARIAGGMEAEVYAFNAEAVFKLYRGAERLPELGALMDFYQALAGDALPYRLPRIRTLAAEGDFCVTLEDRLPGEVLAAHLPGLADGAMAAVMEGYLDAVLALACLPLPDGMRRHWLLDTDGFSAFANGDWHTFLRAFLQRRLHASAACLRRDVTGWDEKLDRMERLLSQPYSGELRVVHGDFFPGNLLVEVRLPKSLPPTSRLPKSPKTSEVLEICALLDFGLFTMLGDPLFDLATAWVFFDMYDDLKIDARARLLERILARLGEGVRGRMYRYVLIYSLLSADTYAPDCSDGHYRWCVDNLNQAAYWEGMA
ncbi:MAG: aminoglycoside phosphotransferase family protein [Anaerolineae bacterium]|nr:aminoglycoside phosphotransferase family protein [Anaerolineae bacterium]